MSFSRINSLAHCLALGAMALCGATWVPAAQTNTEGNVGIYDSTPSYALTIRKNMAFAESGESESQMMFTAPMAIFSDVPSLEFCDLEAGNNDWTISVNDSALYFTSSGSATNGWNYDIFNLFETRVEVGKELVPRTHHGTNLGRYGLAFNAIYYAALIPNGILDYSTTSVLSTMLKHAPKPKPENSFDAQKSAYAQAGVYARELDPASLPMTLTGYYELREDYENNTNPEWVAQSKTTLDPWLKTEVKPTAAQVQEYIASYQQEHRHPDQLTPQEWGISLNQMVSWCYKGLFEAAQQLNALASAQEQLEATLKRQQQEIDELKAELQAVKQMIAQ